MSNIIMGRFQTRKVPSPKLSGDPMPEEALPHFLLGASLCALVAEAQRIRITNGKDAALWAIEKARQQIEACE